MKEFERLVSIMKKLRAPGGCPWDREQTHESISRCAIEEAYELAEAIDRQDTDLIMEETGDVLLQAIFHSLIAEDNGEFSLADAINGLSDKLVYRHPHVFGDIDVENSQEVIRNWEKLKRKEETKLSRKSILDGVPGGMPALLVSRKLQSAASRVGFDWEDIGGVIDKVHEEANELADSVAEKDAPMIEHEVGDLLFSVVNLCRALKVDPETSLRKANLRFRNRFFEIEKEARRRGVSLEEMSIEEMDEIWEKAKKTVG